MNKTKHFKRLWGTLLLLIAMLVPHEAWAIEYIKEIKVSVDEKKGETARNRLTNDGYTLVERDLNGGGGGYYIYIGYKTTTNVAEAITDLLIVESNGFDAHAIDNITNANITYKGKKYYRCENYNAGNARLDCDLNRGRTGTPDIVLFYTTDGNTQEGGRPLTSLAVVDDTSSKGVVYTRHWKYDTPEDKTDPNEIAADTYGNTNSGCNSPHYIIYGHVHAYDMYGLCTCGNTHPIQGSGTEANPYLVTCYTDLVWLGNKTRSNGNFHAKQTCNIDCGGRSIVPLGGSNGTFYYFTGTYDGGGFVISNARYVSHDERTDRRVGIFGAIKGATVKNLGVVGCHFEGRTSIGAVCGWIEPNGSNISTIENCFAVKNTLQSNETCAGICATVLASTLDRIKHCYTDVNIQNGRNITEGCYAVTGDFGTRITEEDLKSGYLCYTLNQSSLRPWYQKLGTDDYPIMQKSENNDNIVYKFDHLKCDGKTANGTVTYTNNSKFSAPVDLHQYANDFTVDVEATCIKKGSKSKHCTVCETEKTQETEIAMLNHTMTKHDAVTPTCIADGSLVYYTCSRTCCKDKLYKDNASHTTNEYGSAADLVDKKLGHNYGGPSWSWKADGSSATCSRTCTRTSCTDKTTGHTVSASATKIDSKVKVPAKCTEWGTTTYTATATVANSTYTNDFDVENLEALGHSYGEGVWTWIWYDREHSATCTRTCQRDVCTDMTMGHTASVRTTVGDGIDDGVETQPATCSAKGITTYTATATVENVEYKSTHEVADIAMLPHTFDKHVCTVCSADEEPAVTGTQGECTWRIYADGEMIVSPTNGASGSLGNWEKTPSWYEQRTAIKSVRFTGSVTANTLFKAFHQCNNITSIDLTNLNTSQVKDMSYLFNQCTSLTTINWGSFDTSNATTMKCMFNYCSFTSLDLRCFNTSNVVDMFFMFRACQKLTNVDLSSFDTKNVTDFSGMFENCNKLTNLDLSNFSTANATNMSSAFHNCSDLQSLTIGNFDMSKATYCSDMFDGTNNLSTLTLTSVPYLKEGTFDTAFEGKTVICQLDDNSTVYEGENHLPTITQCNHFFSATDPAVAATCETDGITEGSHCKVCAEVLVAQEIVTALGHSYTVQSDNEAYLAADVVACTDNTYYYKCANCDAHGTKIWTKAGTATGQHTFAANDPSQSVCTVCNHGFFRYTATAKVDPWVSTELKNAEGVSIYNADKHTFADDGKGVMEFDSPLAEIGGSAFMFRPALTAIDLQSISRVGTDAFAECPNLTSVTARCDLDLSNTGINESVVTRKHDCTLKSETDTYLATAANCGNDATYYYKCANCDEHGTETWTKTGTAKHTYGDDHLCTNCDAKDPGIASGTQGECNWIIYANGEMVISPINGDAGSLGQWSSNPSWYYSGKELIKTVRFEGNISAMTTQGMFEGCSKLTSVDLSSFNTAKVTNMGSMFEGCSSLTELDLSSFNTANVTDFSYMLYNCSNLTKLTLGNFDMSKASSYSSMVPYTSQSNTLIFKSVPYIQKDAFSYFIIYYPRVICELDENSVVYKGENPGFPALNSGTAPCSLDLAGSAVENHPNLTITHNFPHDYEMELPEENSGYFHKVWYCGSCAEKKVDNEVDYCRMFGKYYDKNEKHGETISLTKVGDYYYTMLYTDFPYSNDLDAYVYEVDNVEGDKVILTNLGSTMSHIESYRPVIIRSEYSSLCLEYDKYAVFSEPATGSLAQGTTEAITEPDEDMYAFSVSDTGYLGFWRWPGMTIPAWKGYLRLPYGANAKGMRLVFNEEDGTATSIELAPADASADGFSYDFAGRRVNKVHGLGIINGKKVYIKKK